MSNPMRLVAAIAVVAIAGVAAFNLFGSSPGVGGVASPSPTMAPSTAAPTPTPSSSASPTPYAINTATWQTYTSRRYGFSIGYPADWYVYTTATRDWTYPADATVDCIARPWRPSSRRRANIAAAAWSVAVTSGTRLDAWIQAYCALSESPAPSDAQCRVGPSRSTHGWSRWLARAFALDTEAFFLVNNRMYVVAIWQPEDFIPGGVSRLLEAYLSTMHLLPGGPAPSGTSPSPS